MPYSVKFSHLRLRAPVPSNPVPAALPAILPPRISGQPGTRRTRRFTYLSSGSGLFLLQGCSGAALRPADELPPPGLASILSFHGQAQGQSKSTDKNTM